MSGEPPASARTAFEEGRRLALSRRASEGLRAPLPGGEGAGVARPPVGRADVVRAEAVPEPEPASASAALSPRDEGARAPVPVAELARAFQANAEALRTLGTLQAELLSAVQRNDRAEMMLAGTQALNDSFRNLAHVQRELLSRLEESGRLARRGGRLVPLLLLGVAGLVVLATWVLVDLGQRFIDAQPDPQALTAEAARLLQEGREEASAAALAEARRLAGRLEESEERLRSSQSRLDAEREEHARAQRELGAKEAELDALRRQAGVAQTEALKLVSLEAEVRDLTARLALGEPRLTQLGQELDEVRRENARLRRKLAGAAYGLPDEDPEPAAAPPVPAGVPASGARPENLVGPGAPSAVPPPAQPASAPPPPGTPPAAPGAGATRAETESARDPRVIGQVRSTLNSLLEAGRGAGTEYWQLMRVDAVLPDRMRGVIANRYDADGRLIESIEAQEAYVWVERERRRVLLEVREGQRVSKGQRASLPDGRLTAVVAEGEGLVSVFAQSGLKLVRTR